MGLLWVITCRGWFTTISPVASDQAWRLGHEGVEEVGQGCHPLVANYWDDEGELVIPIGHGAVRQF